MAEVLCGVGDDAEEGRGVPARNRGRVFTFYTNQPPSTPTALILRPPHPPLFKKGSCWCWCLSGWIDAREGEGERGEMEGWREGAEWKCTSGGGVVGERPLFFKLSRRTRSHKWCVGRPHHADMIKLKPCNCLTLLFLSHLAQSAGDQVEPATPVSPPSLPPPSPIIGLRSRCGGATLCSIWHRGTTSTSFAVTSKEGAEDLCPCADARRCERIHPRAPQRLPRRWNDQRKAT